MDRSRGVPGVGGNSGVRKGEVRMAFTWCVKRGVRKYVVMCINLQSDLGTRCPTLSKLPPKKGWGRVVGRLEKRQRAALGVSHAQQGGSGVQVFRREEDEDTRASGKGVGSGSLSHTILGGSTKLSRDVKGS